MRKENTFLDQVMYAENFNTSLIVKAAIINSVSDIKKKFMQGGNGTVHFKNRKSDRTVTHGEINNLINHPTSNIKISYIEHSKGALEKIMYLFYGYIENDLWCVSIAWNVKKHVIPITIFKVDKISEKDPHGWTNQTSWYSESNLPDRGYFLNQEIAYVNHSEKYFKFKDDNDQPITLDMKSSIIVELVRKVKYNDSTYYVVCWEDPKTFKLYFSNTLIPEDDICLKSKEALIQEVKPLQAELDRLTKLQVKSQTLYFFAPLTLSVVLLLITQQMVVYFGIFGLIFSQYFLYRNYIKSQEKLSSEYSLNAKQVKKKIKSLNKVIELYALYEKTLETINKININD